MSGRDDHERLREDLAGYVLGGLTVDEQHAVEAHLAACPACREELAELDPVPVLLDLARPGAVADPVLVGTGTRAGTEADTEAGTDHTASRHGRTTTHPRRRAVLASACVAAKLGNLRGKAGRNTIGSPPLHGFLARRTATWSIVEPRD